MNPNPPRLLRVEAVADLPVLWATLQRLDLPATLDRHFPAPPHWKGPLPPGGSLLAGDTVLFALSVSRPGQLPCYVKGGDSVLVLLTGVTDLGAIDPATGQPLVRIAWEPLGQYVPPVTDPGRGVKSRRSQRMT
jgi:hypothetical protein